MDYDKSDIASVYDDARAFALEVLRQWLGVLSAHLAGRVISLIIDLTRLMQRFDDSAVVGGVFG